MTTVRSAKPSCVWVSPARISGRVDASYFHCDYLPLDENLVHFAKREVTTLGRLLTHPRRVLYQQTTTYARGDAPQGSVPFISGVDIDGSTMSIDWESVRYVDSWMLEKYPKGRLSDGTLLIKVKGPNQHTAFVTHSEQTALVSGTVFFGGVRDCNPYYLAAYLSSGAGTAWRARLRTNTTVEFIGNEELRAVPVLVPGPPVQEFIGAKIALAERCRLRSYALRVEATSRFNFLLKTQAFRPSSSLTRMVNASALANRLNGEFYLPRYFDLEAHLASLNFPVKPLRALLRVDVIKTSTPDRVVDGAVPCILTSDIDPHQISWRRPSLRVTAEVHASHSGRLEALDVVYTSVGPPVGEAAVLLPQFLPMAVGGDVSILRCGDELHPGYLSLYLNSVFGQMQNDRYSRGIRQRRVYPEDVGAFSIPRLPRDQQAFIGDRIVRHQVLSERAVDFVNEAKDDVEALIAGTLDTKSIIAGRTKPPTSRDVPGLENDDA
jgi:type I restriction enzyme, S subunit